MKDIAKRNRSIRKTWSIRSIVENVNARKSEQKKEGSIVKKSFKNEYFPIDNSTLHRIEKKYGVINPDGTLNVLWDVWMLFSLLIRAYLIPYEISFDPGLIHSSKYVIFATDLACLVDILINFNTGFYFKGFLVADRLAIVKNYLRHNFTLDLIGSIPFQMFFNQDSLVDSDAKFGIEYLRFILLAKFIHLYRIKSMIYAFEDKFTSINSVTALKFFHFFLLISFMAHWTSCLCHFFYLQELQQEGDLEQYFIYDTIFRYVTYLYSAVFTITGIGYYALNIATIDQKIITILIMCCDIIIFAYILGKIQSTLNSYQHEGNETKRLLKMCKVYISQNEIPGNLRHKILKFVSFCRENERKGVEKESDLLSSLSLPLREEIFTQTRGLFLAKQAIFKIYEPKFLKFVGYHLKIQIFGPEDSIFEEGMNGSLIYFIQSGRVEIYHSKTTTTFKTLKKGKCFGEIAFFLGSSRTASAKSEGFSELLTLSWSTMKSILSCRPKEKKLTDEILSSAETVGLSVLHIRCYFCNKLGHIASTCKKFVIPLRMENIVKKADTSKYAGSKKVNLNEAYKFTFQRPDPVYSVKNFRLMNTTGKGFNIKNAYKARPSLLKKALNLKMRDPLIIKKNKKRTLMEEEEEESSSDFENKSPLPLAMQYRMAFLKNSRQRKQKNEENKALESFDPDLSESKDENTLSPYSVYGKKNELAPKDDTFLQP